MTREFPKVRTDFNVDEQICDHSKPYLTYRPGGQSQGNLDSMQQSYAPTEAEYQGRPRETFTRRRSRAETSTLGGKHKDPAEAHFAHGKEMNLQVDIQASK